jgi:hypothetical protein
MVDVVGYPGSMVAVMMVAILTVTEPAAVVVAGGIAIADPQVEKYRP